MRLVSHNFLEDGVVDFAIGDVPPAGSAGVVDSWARFPYGVDFVLRKSGYNITKGMDAASKSAVIYLNHPLVSLISTCVRLLGNRRSSTAIFLAAACPALHRCQLTWCSASLTSTALPSANPSKSA